MPAAIHLTPAQIALLVQVKNGSFSAYLHDTGAHHRYPDAHHLLDIDFIDGSRYNHETDCRDDIVWITDAGKAWLADQEKPHEPSSPETVAVTLDLEAEELETLFALAKREPGRLSGLLRRWLRAEIDR